MTLLNKSDQRGSANTALLLIIATLTTLGAGFGSWTVANSRADKEIAELDERIENLKDELDTKVGSPPPSAQPGAPAAASSGGAQAAQSAAFTSANLGFSVTVPAEWVGKWRYQESGEIGISIGSVTFALLNKETKYAEAVTVAKIPEAKYDDAKAQNQPVANPENLLGREKGHVFVMTFPDGSGDFKDFTYQQATTAARTSLKTTFKIL